MATVAAATAVNPAWLIKDVFGAIPEVEQVFMSRDSDRRISVLTVIASKDEDVQKRVFASELEIVDALAGVEVGFDLIIREGRPLRQLVSPRGILLFARQ